MPSRIMVAAGCIAALLLAGTAAAQDAKSLQKCLDAFDGVIWRLPYSPRLSAGNCHVSAASAGKVESADIEFFQHEVVEHDSYGLDYDTRYAADKKATFTFFEQLFRRYGYTLESSEAASGAVPYVQSAVFRHAGGTRIEYANTASNVYKLTLKKAGQP